MMWTWLFQRRQHRGQPVFPDTLNSWEARPLTRATCKDLQASRQTNLAEAVEEVDHEMVPAHR